MNTLTFPSFLSEYMIMQKAMWNLFTACLSYVSQIPAYSTSSVESCIFIFSQEVRRVDNPHVVKVLSSVSSRY